MSGMSSPEVHPTFGCDGEAASSEVVRQRSPLMTAGIQMQLSGFTLSEPTTVRGVEVPPGGTEFVEIGPHARWSFLHFLPCSRTLSEIWRVESNEEGDLNSLIGLCWEVITLSLPTSVGSILQFSLQAITSSFVGRRMGSDVFAHFMIGVSVFNIFGLSIGLGLVSALDTLVSQSFGRFKQSSSEIGECLQRATLVNLGLMVPLGLLFVFGRPIWMVTFGDEGGAGAAVFTSHAVVYLFAAIMTSTLNHVLTSINEPVLPMYVNAVVTVACFVLNYYFTSDSVVSAVYVLTATYLIYLVLLLGVFVFHPRITFWRNCRWPSPNMLNRAGLEEYLRIGIPSLVSVVAEWWAFEVLQIIAANIGMRQVAELNVITAVSGMMFSVGLGVSVAASVRIGNALGENKPVLARRFAVASFMVSQGFSLLDGAVVILFRGPIAAIFTNEPSLESEFGTLVFLLALHHWLDSTQFLFQGVFRGAGMQSQAVRAVLMSLWLVGLPLSVILGKLLQVGTAGIMLGIIVGFCVEIPLLFNSFRSWNWRGLALNAAKKAPSDHGNEGSVRDDEVDVGEELVLAAAPETSVDAQVSNF